MEETVNQDSSQEIVNPSADIQQEAQAQPEVQKEESSWIKDLRRGHKDANRRADEAERKAKMQEELIQQLLQKQALTPKASEPEEDIIAELSKEEYVPGEKVAKGFMKIQAKFDKKLEEVQKMYTQKQYTDQIQELKKDFPDLEDVVNPETIALMQQKNPRIAQTWRGLDDYSIYINAYPIIKASGILDDQTNTRRATEVEKKLEQNKKTVQTPQAFDKRPIAQAFKMTEDEKKKLAEEMYHYANQAGGY